MEFCPNDGSLLIPKVTDGKVSIVCPTCGHSSSSKDNAIVKEKVKEADKIEITKSDSDLEVLPKVDAECPKCGHDKAAFWEEQTRSSDEPPTKFFKCIKCKNTWRSYD